jgi:hypothetical protein
MVESLVLLEVIMRGAERSLSKQTALILFCYFRQAERSVHYALSFPNQWPQFRAYYGDAKRTQIAKLIGLLRAAGATRDDLGGGQVLKGDGLLAGLGSVVALVCNPFRRRWTFSVQELSFLLATLETLLRDLCTDDPPEKPRLIALRRDCFQCHSIISRKLVGLPELRKAASIEHFNQSEYAKSVTLEEIGLQDAQELRAHALHTGKDRRSVV